MDAHRLTGIATEVRRMGHADLIGVALLVPSATRATMLMDGADAPFEYSFSDQAWRQIDEWVTLGNERLPSRPPDLQIAAAAPPIAGDVSIRRFASIPLATEATDLAQTTERLLPGLLRARRQQAGQ